ncbi:MULTISPECIES: ABC transporter ATP-binding protein [Streptomyces]|uniref:ATP-binding cassette domain-containing protein n=1 Tax=Streptomyces doudnae TaxID=3075536 RepID=A0ABD5EWX0_9ACTN|nr:MULTISPECIES: ATP-binding cassette domain-containing protein [unclassified Streptomyces]MDT0438844.1 ATP-binding cassette domain-containing protein [Streptomyces sp. DSM 41981]MYQ66648.1 ATP-binding cassette domain-containing protein [Streptomyces sp. SID4950]SCE23343.1 ABC-type multidrug transport system, ATPase component [Streptomyces sp. SolWspMP-5a-2]
MIQAFGLTSNPRKDTPPAVDDISFEARAGHVTALLGGPGAGKTTALRLMLELQQGRGITYFRGRPLHRISHPSREVGVLLGDVPGHPARTVRGHLRMLCAAAGVPVCRADEVLEVVGLVSLREERLGTLSRGMDRRLGLACVLLSDPHTLVLDDPADGLSARETRWLQGMLRAHAAQGGTVLITAGDPKEVARSADRVVSLDKGKVVADQAAADFARTRLRPRVAVRSPHAARLAALLAKEARADRRSVEVVREGGNRLSVYGGTCADVGETAFRHGILVHQLADEVGDMGPGAGTEPDTAAASAAEAQGDADGAPAAGAEPERSGAVGASCPAVTAGSPSAARSAATTRPEPPSGQRKRVGAPRTLDALPALPPPISVRSAPSPLRPLRYEIRRATGIGTGFLIAAAVLVVSVVTAVLLARIGHTPQARLLAAWPQQVPLPPAALGAGLIGALAFGDEFRHPALAADRGTVPRRLGLLAAKLLVTAATALALAVLAIGCDAEMLYLVYGRELTQVPADWFPAGASWLGLVIGCAWAGVLAAGVFRSTTAGLAAVLAVPVVVVPLVHKAFEGPSVRTAAGFPLRVREVLLVQWPFGGERYLVAVARVLAQPVGSALALSVTVLLCAYLFTTLRTRLR